MSLIQAGETKMEGRRSGAKKEEKGGGKGRTAEEDERSAKRRMDGRDGDGLLVSGRVASEERIFRKVSVTGATSASHLSGRPGSV